MDRREFLKTAGLAAIGSGAFAFVDPGLANSKENQLSSDLAISKHSDIVNVRDYGAMGDGVNDDAPAIQSAIEHCRQLPFPHGTRAVYIPTGRYRLNSTLTVYDHTKLVGENPIDTGTEFWFYGGGTANCMESFSPAATQKGMFWIEGIRVKDKRKGPVSGSGLVLENFDNATRIRMCEFSDFPTYQIHLRAPANHNIDNIEILSTWITCTVPHSTGIYIERCVNNVVIDRMYVDNLADDCHGIEIANNVANDDCVINISNCKFEVDSSTTSPSIVLHESHGSVTLTNIVQTATGKGSTVVEISDASTGKISMRNITGERHQTWGAAPHTVHILRSQARKIDGHIGFMTITPGGYPVRTGLGGMGAPEGKEHGFVGEIFHRTDGGTGSALYVKELGNGNNTGWFSVSSSQRYKQKLTPKPVRANTTSEQKFKVKGVVKGYDVTVTKPSHQAGLGVVNVRAVKDGQVAITFMNTTGKSITPTSETYTITQMIVY